MPPKLKGTTREKLAIHQNRHIPDTLLKKRCEDRFAQELHDYAEEEGHRVEWALIFESGRQNKMLLVSVYGWHDVFPVRYRGDGESSSDDDEGKDREEDASVGDGEGAETDDGDVKEGDGRR